MTRALPPIEPLLEVGRILDAARVEYALGGSGLLHALGLARRVHDWDLTTDAPPDAVERIFGSLPHELHGPAGIHADSKLRLHGGQVELIVGMAMRTQRGICRIPTVVSGTWSSVPLGSPEAWAVAYALMGRARRAARLFRHLRERGADPATVARLLREPRPATLEAQLARLAGERKQKGRRSPADPS